MRLNDLLKQIQYISVTTHANPEIREITNNTAEIVPGDVFVCIKGFKTDGHSFTDKAVLAGASVIIASDPVECGNVPVVTVKDTREALACCSKVIYGDPSSKLKIIGVTGTNGKTTVSYLIKSILEEAGYTVGLIGTNETIVGDRVVPAMRTTPEAHKLNKLFTDMLKMGAQYCVMEVSSHSLELHRVTGIHFVAGVFTNLTHDHLDFHITMENYFSAKAKLFSMCETGVINIDDKWGNAFADSVKDTLVTYSIEKESMNPAENVHLLPAGNEFDLGGTHYTMKIPGNFSVYNGLAAICTCKALGVSPDVISRGLAGSPGAKGRAEVVDVPAEFKVVIDYAHTPDGLLNILTTLKKFAPAKILCVFGAAGERDSAKRPEMGEIVGTYADLAIITADNPINEDLTLICRQVEEGLKKTACPYSIVYDREEAIKKALSEALPGDIVLLAGKGHETYQLIGDEKIPFSEEKIVKGYFEG